MSHVRLVARGLGRCAAPSGRRLFSATAGLGSSGAPAPKIVAPSETDAAAVRAALDQLLSSRWTLTAAGDGLERSFQFKTFTKTWDFMTAVALQCKLKNHHPEWSNVYNTTFVRWTTHSPTPGLTRKDTELAALCDALARDFGETTPTTPTTTTSASLGGACGMQGLANQAATVSGGDCCTPSKGKKDL